MRVTRPTALVKSLLAALLFVSLVAHADDRPPGVPSEARWVKVDRVTDGDTIVLMDRTRVRLHGIDAPERDQPYGPIATAALAGSHNAENGTGASQFHPLMYLGGKHHNYAGI